MQEVRCDAFLDVKQATSTLRVVDRRVRNRPRVWRRHFQRDDAQFDGPGFSEASR